MAVCDTCGGSLTQEARFCPHCGREQTAPAQPVVTQVVPAGNKRRAFRTIAAVACVVIVLAAGVLAGTQWFARDILRLLMGEQGYALHIEENLLSALADNGAALFDQAGTLYDGADGRVSAAVQMEGTLDNRLRAWIEEEGGAEELAVIDELLAYLKDVSFTSAMTTQDGLQAIEGAAGRDGTTLLGAQIWRDDDRMIFRMPEASEKYVVLEGVPQEQKVTLPELDKEKFRASLHRVLGAYLEVLGEAAVTTHRNQTLEVGGVAVTADRITLALDGQQLQRALCAAVEAARDDDYLEAYVLETARMYYEDLYAAGWLTEPGVMMDSDDYRALCDAAADTLRNLSSQLQGAEIRVYMDRGNHMVAREYVAVPRYDTAQEWYLRLVMPRGGWQKGGFAAALGDRATEVVRLTVIPDGRNAGTALLRLEQDGRAFGLQLAYQDAALVSFAGETALTGSFALSLYDPGGVWADLARLEQSPFPDLLDSTIVVDSRVEREICKDTVVFDLQGIGVFTLRMDMTVDRQPAVSLPAVDDGNAFFLPLDGDDRQVQLTLADIGEEFGLGLAEHFKTLTQEDPVLEELLEIVGLSPQQLEAGLRRGTFPFGLG